MDHWYAECLPCKWEQTFDTQASAITAAEQHVLDAHRDLFALNGVERTREMVEQKIGHVQFRSENTVGAGVTSHAAPPDASEVELSLDAQIDRANQEVNDKLEALALLKQKQLADSKES